MTKNDFINKIQETIDIEVTKKDLTHIVEAIGTVVTDTLKNDSDEKITLPGLGSFKVKEVAERSGVTALTGKPWTKPAHKSVVFKVTKSLKEI